MPYGVSSSSCVYTALSCVSFLPNRMNGASPPNIGVLTIIGLARPAFEAIALVRCAQRHMSSPWEGWGSTVFDQSLVHHESLVHLPFSYSYWLWECVTITNDPTLHVLYQLVCVPFPCSPDIVTQLFPSHHLPITYPRHPSHYPSVTHFHHPSLSPIPIFYSFTSSLVLCPL